MVKMKLYLFVPIILIAVIMLGACSKTAPPVGGPCTYKDILGKATIVSVEPAPPDEYNCADAVQVTFDFVPNDPAAVANYRVPTWKDTGNHFTVGAGMNPPINWAQSQGLTAGSVHTCVRSEIASGTCTPVIFSFPEISNEGWDTECFKK
jgi:hypothetical protein